MGVCVWVCKYAFEGPCRHKQDRQKLKCVSVGVSESESCSEGEGETRLLVQVLIICSV